MRIDADAREGEFGHVGAADDHRARGFEPRDDGRIARRNRRIVARLGAGQRALAGDIEEILDRDRQTGERRRLISGAAQPILRIRGAARFVRIDFGEAALALAGRIGDP